MKKGMNSRKVFDMSGNKFKKRRIAIKEIMTNLLIIGITKLDLMYVKKSFSPFLKNSIDAEVLRFILINGSKKLANNINIISFPYSSIPNSEVNTGIRRNTIDASIRLLPI